MKNFLLIAAALLTPAVIATPAKLEKRTADHTTSQSTLPTEGYSTTTIPTASAGLATAITGPADNTYTLAGPSSGTTLTFFTGDVPNGFTLKSAGWTVEGLDSTDAGCTGNFGLYVGSATSATPGTTANTDGFQTRAKAALSSAIVGPATVTGKAVNAEADCSYDAIFALELVASPLVVIDEPAVVGGVDEVNCDNISLETVNTGEQTIPTDGDSITAAELTFEAETFALTGLRYTVSVDCANDATDGNFTIAIAATGDDYEGDIGSFELYHETTETATCFVGYMNKYDWNITDQDTMDLVTGATITITADAEDTECTYTYHFDYFTTGLTWISEESNEEYTTCETIDDVPEDYDNQELFNVTNAHTAETPFFILDSKIVSNAVGFKIAVNGVDQDDNECTVTLQTYSSTGINSAYSALTDDIDLEGCCNKDIIYFGNAEYISLSLYGDFAEDEWCAGKYVLDFIQAFDEDEGSHPAGSCDADYPADAEGTRIFPNVTADASVLVLNATFEADYTEWTAQYVDVLISVSNEDDEDCVFQFGISTYDTDDMEEPLDIFANSNIESCFAQRITLRPGIKHLIGGVSNTGENTCDVAVQIAYNNDDECPPNPGTTATVTNTVTQTVSATDAGKGSGGNSGASGVSAGIQYLIASALAAWALF